MAVRDWKMNTQLQFFRRLNSSTILMTDDQDPDQKHTFHAMFISTILEHDRMLREGQYVPVAPPIGYDNFALVYNAEQVTTKLAVLRPGIGADEGKEVVDFKGPSPSIADFEVELSDIFTADVLTNIMGDGSRVYDKKEVAIINNMLMTNAMRNDAFELRQMKKSDTAVKRELNQDEKDDKAKALRFNKKPRTENYPAPPTQPRGQPRDRRDMREFDYRDARDRDYRDSSYHYGGGPWYPRDSRDYYVQRRERSPDMRGRYMSPPPSFRFIDNEGQEREQPRASASGKKDEKPTAAKEVPAAAMEVDGEEKN
ncbi:hypothetical protein B0H17DRAFT_1059296 [Mycena rosella]|uniref:Uncharacterized protein n=1 Tax=Mycena rosella TaxID=1033263 RepID=A0AAD7DNA9_MYCRO|nr:hypothetical protein B0H17DRAFT_1059296 [Mycena rosella]